MNLFLKMTVGLYVLSVLAFSSWSRADDGFELNLENVHSFSITMPAVEEREQEDIFDIQPISLNTRGYVFENDGHLFFQTKETNHPFLIHSNSWSLFEDIKLPIEVSIQGYYISKEPDPYRLTETLDIQRIHAPKSPSKAQTLKKYNNF